MKKVTTTRAPAYLTAQALRVLKCSLSARVESGAIHVTFKVYGFPGPAVHAYAHPVNDAILQVKVDLMAKFEGWTGADVLLVTRRNLIPCLREEIKDLRVKTTSAKMREEKALGVKPKIAKTKKWLDVGRFQSLCVALAV